MKQINNICLITDENYVITTITSINSLVKNCTFEGNVYVLFDTLSDYAKDLIESLSSDKIKVIAKPVDTSRINLGVTHKYVSNCAMIKFLLADIFSDLDKILYVDGDTLILEDLKDLFLLDIKKHYGAVVADMLFAYEKKHHKNLNLPNYFNSGVMLLNLQKMRNDNMVERLIYNKVHEKYHIFMDQDSLNQSFEGNVMWLPLKYNFLLLNYSLKEMANFYKTSIKEMKQTINKPAILHYAGCLKPWNTIDAPRFSIWFSYFKSLPESSLKTEKLAEIQFQLKELPKKKIKEFIQQIFSVKNSQNKKHKMITILGLKVKIKRSK